MPLAAQTEERRATMRGGGGADYGKCTIEVRVDGAAEVEIRGDRGLLRTTSGTPARWVRFECSGVMPPNPSDFKFSGVDGRGTQSLVRDPRSGGRSAIVRIEDPSGGAENYTFDIEWRGVGTGAYGGYGYGQSARDPYVRGEYSSSQALDACQAAVRDRASRDLGTSDVQFRRERIEDNPGRDDVIMGRVDVRRNGGAMESYRFNCSMNLANGRVRTVDLTPLSSNTGSYFPSVRGGTDRGIMARASQDCQKAVEQRLRREAYRVMEIGPVNVDDRQGRNDWIGGMVTGRRNNTDYNFDYGCSVNLNNGNIRSVEVNPR